MSIVSLSNVHANGVQGHSHELPRGWNHPLCHRLETWALGDEGLKGHTYIRGFR